MGDNEIKITVKFCGRPIPITLSPDSTVLRLKNLLLPLTNVLPRGQKLIFKETLGVAGVTNGVKLMLIGTQGVHQGDGPILKEAQSPITSRKTDRVRDMKMVPVGKTSSERWKATGVIAMAEHNLKAIPDEVWDCSPFIRVLDIRTNSIQCVPDQIDGLTGLKKLLLDANDLSNDSISWVQLAKLKHLTVLSISRNCFYSNDALMMMISLNSLPGILGHLTALQHLDVSNNKLTTLPTEIGLLSKLEVLKANNNRISFLPESIGNCTSLIEIDLSSNLLSELPVTLENLHYLKALHLDNNALKSLPTTLFSKCVQLSTLELHNTEITMDALRQLEGWDDFDKRRRAKHQKQLDFRVMGSTEFDEGADKS
ncbi:LRR repeats and ubiquitin-like domain-containing protein [Citrus sinensis]|uniref:LRR repeats and ubiquitin-like domain-containing protein n=1 Tax=Citrus sinensis TaxID=2711 RepID=A0ACB8IXM4_CITSI|nr:LRR repeats and ubiquitin-like domain-containing protein [Citrus sinensis]